MSNRKYSYMFSVVISSGSISSQPLTGLHYLYLISEYGIALKVTLLGFIYLYFPIGLYQASESTFCLSYTGRGYIGLLSLLGVSLQWTLPSGCSVQYLWPLFRNNPENCETSSPCQTLSSCLRATCTHFGGY